MSTTSFATDGFTLELQQIRGLIEGNHLQQAALALNAAQKKAPADARVPLIGMRLAEQAGNLQGAVHAARHALALAPGWHVAQIELALLLAKQKQGQEALALAMQAMASAPQQAQVTVGAINVALFSGDDAQTLAWAEDGVRRFPHHAGIRLFLARFLAAQGQHAQAHEHFEHAHARAPQMAEPLQGLLTCALNQQDMALARQWADRLLALKPQDEDARYWHAVAHGQTPHTQPEEVVTGIFDDYAPRFDDHLIHGLRYRVPKRVAEILNDQHPERRFNLLDLGCGTGQVAAYLGRIEGHIIGVDLSEKMIGQAAKLGLYSRFHRINVLDALSHTPADHYEAITATDVLVYVGDLGPVIPNAWRILKPGGHFIFSCETATEDEPDLVLRERGNRFAHKASAVERQLRSAGFDDIVVEHLPALRLEGGQPLPGFLVTARKPAAA